MRKQSGGQNLDPHVRDGQAAADLAAAVTVLHVDDDPNDSELLKAAARKAEAQFVLHNVVDGDQAMAYLSGAGPRGEGDRRRLPALILLDLKMPRTTGFEVLKWIRKQPWLASIPVLVLSGSELQDDIQEAYEHGANSYLIKPLGFDALVSLVKTIDTLWLATAVQGAL
jgi:CheY-like chemotaxis protein